MQKLIVIVGASGIGKTSLVHALSATGLFATAYEQHEERPFQKLFKENRQFALANQIDYLLLCAEQERALRSSALIGLMDGGLDLNLHGFTRLFLSRGLLTQPEYDLCLRLYRFLRTSLPGPELIIRLRADEATISSRLSRRDRINIASAKDITLFDTLLDEWLGSVPTDQVLSLDVSNESLAYEHSTARILRRLNL